MFFKKRNKVYLLTLITSIFIGGVLRFIGIIPGYPPYHADEGVSYSQATAMILEHSLDPKHGYGNPYNYPILVPLINAILFLSFFLPLRFAQIVLWLIVGLISQVNGITAKTLVNNEVYRGVTILIFGEHNINSLYWSRFITALFGTMIILMTYLLSRKLFKSYLVAVLSALFVSINYREVLNSHLGLPDIYNCFFLLLSLYLIILLWERATRKHYFLAGIGIALYFSTKLQIFTIFPLFFVLFLFFIKNKNWQERFKFLISRNLLILILTTISVILILNIFLIIHWNEARQQIGYTALKYRYGRSTLDFYPISYIYHIGIGKIASFLCVLGIFLGLFYKFFPTALLLTVILPFFWFMVYFTGGGFYTRNFITIIPLLLIFSSLAVVLITGGIKKYNNFFSLTFFCLLIILISQESVKNSIWIPIEYSKKWHFVKVQEWVDKNIPQDSIIASHPTMILSRNKFTLANEENPEDYIIAEMQDKKIQWVIINLDWINVSYYWWMVQDTGKSVLFWERPDIILENNPVTKMTQELKRYVAFETLSPWQAPQSNFLVVKIPPKIDFTKGILKYQNSFDTPNNDWIAMNDGFGNLSNFSWDGQVGNIKKGSLKIDSNGGAFYSQRFVSNKIPIEGHKLYKITGMLLSSKKIDQKDKESLIGIDFLSQNGKYITSALSSRLVGGNYWTEKELVVVSPKDARYIQIFFQTGSFKIASYWLDDVEVWQSDGIVDNDSDYIKSGYDPITHLFPYSHGGM